MRIGGPGYGLPLAGFVAGFVSSTATTNAMDIRLRHDPEVLNPASTAAVLSIVATFVQLAVIIVVTSRATPQSLLCLCFAVGSVALVYSMLFRFGQRLRAQSNTRRAVTPSTSRAPFSSRGAFRRSWLFLRLLTPGSVPARRPRTLPSVRECEGSRREALVAMVHTTDLGDGDDFSDLGHLYRPLLRAILV